MRFFHRIMRAVLVCVVLSFALAGAEAWAGLAEDQRQALVANAQSGDKAALETLMTEASQGDIFAQGALGVLYTTGQGVPQDHFQAVQWFRKAAEHGHTGAQVGLGWAYQEGQGVPQDYGQAAQWFRKSAAQGNPLGQISLGQLYEKGQGVPQDYGQAVQWFREAAAQGFAPAEFKLGGFYFLGQGVPQNNVVAYALFNLAAAQDSSFSKSRSLLTVLITKQEIVAGQALSRRMSAPGQLLQALDDYMAASR